MLALDPRSDRTPDLLELGDVLDRVEPLHVVRVDVGQAEERRGPPRDSSAL